MPATAASAPADARPRRPVAGLPALAVSIGLVALAILAPMPAVAATDAPPPAVGSGTGAPPTSEEAAEAARSVVLEQASLAAEAAYLAAGRRARELRGHAATLDVRAAAAAAEAAAWARRTEDDAAGSLASTLAGLVGGETELERATDAMANQRHAAALARAADEAAQDAADAERAARRAWVQARVRAARFETAQAAWDAANQAIRQSRFGRGYQAADPAQRAREQRALRQWHSYLTSLARAEVVPPLAATLDDPDALPDRLRPALDARGQAVPGVARLEDGRDRLVVLPAETIEAVSETFSMVGASEVADRLGTEEARCGGQSSAAWADTTISVPVDLAGQWQQLRELDAGGLQPGDLAFLGADDTGIDTAGLVAAADGRRLIVAVTDPDTGRVGLELVSAGQVRGARRPVAPSTNDSAAPDLAGCGTSIAGPAVTTGLWRHPLGAASYSASAGFGTSGSLWSSGSHTGQDYAAAAGTPVLAMREGVVAVEYPAWAGNLVRIDHGGGVETWYAHLSRVDVADGQRIQAGQVLGAVGSEGNSTGPHLHLEMRLDGEPIDPALVLDTSAAASSLAAYANGSAPATAMCAASEGGPLLRCDAAVAYRLLAASFEEQFGTPLCVTGGYRTLDQQVSLFASKPALAARPGTSNHGWGVAVDLCGGVESFGTPQHEFVVATAPLFGWHHPSWAAAGGSRPEPWHFEFGTSSA